MKAKLLEHTLGILLVGTFFVLLVTDIQEKEASREASRRKTVEPFLQLDFLDFGDPLHRALFKESLDIFHPDRSAGNDSLFQAILDFRQEQFTRPEYKTGGETRGLSPPKLKKLGTMYVQFVLIYLLVMALTFRASQSLAIVRFVKMKQNKASYLAELYRHVAGPRQWGVSAFLRLIALLVMTLVEGISYAVLFAPAYVIAYSMRSGFDTDSYLFMVVLGVVSNGLLVTYANKFYTFLVSESRKGYVQTALVKNLNASYNWAAPEGVPYGAVVRPKSLLPSHVFRHIYLNARHQYLPSLKEHASFLITGLIIIEMALNIQGHLGYELLQSILYRQYDVAVGIVLAIFFTVKASELGVDLWFFRESRRYENRGMEEP